MKTMVGSYSTSKDQKFEKWKRRLSLTQKDLICGFKYAVYNDEPLKKAKDLYDKDPERFKKLYGEI